MAPMASNLISCLMVMAILMQGHHCANNNTENETMPVLTTTATSTRTIESDLTSTMKTIEANLTTRPLESNLTTKTIESTLTSTTIESNLTTNEDVNATTTLDSTNSEATGEKMNWKRTRNGEKNQKSKIEIIDWMFRRVRNRMKKSGKKWKWERERERWKIIDRVGKIHRDQNVWSLWQNINVKKEKSVSETQKI